MLWFTAEIALIWLVEHVQQDIHILIDLIALDLKWLYSIMHISAVNFDEKVLIKLQHGNIHKSQKENKKNTRKF